MSTPPDWDDLARRYLDLWQQNISAAAADPDTARDLAQMISGFGAFAGMGAGMGMAGLPTKTADASSINAALAGIERRLAAIEERLDGLAAEGAKPAAKARKPSSGKAAAAKAKPATPRAAKRRTGRTKKD